jgi:hypothetical protein
MATIARLNAQEDSMPYSMRTTVILLMFLAGAGCSSGGSADATYPSDEAGTADAGVASETGTFPTATPDAAAEGGQCGDNVCQPSETCVTCPNDCGQCLACSGSPSCSNGLALPSQTTERAFDELSAPASQSDAGVAVADGTNCADAQLRLRISRLEVGHQGKEVWLPTGTVSGPPQSYYCLLQASDGAVVASSPDAGSNGTVEVALTKPTALIADYGGSDFAPTDSIFWGQTGPRLTQSNLTVTYSCFQQAQPGSNSFSAVLSAAASAAGSLAGAGPYGWAFGVGAVALQTVSAAIAAAQQQGDWHMFDVTQTIDRSWLLDLTNGRSWSFTQSGGNAAFQYPWSLTLHVESWGCADPKPVSH